ncbi:unnamed protein product [Protopolystoma xenopodis]|uniref:Transmembrane protein n=1 Tax=Protopolystoma xenopodis TaxID=117903 RepID=A0A3S5BN26_9PLAT|nr:unnamed protein product [Protopolystoma xenopodis]
MADWLIGAFLYIRTPLHHICVCCLSFYYQFPIQQGFANAALNPYLIVFFSLCPLFLTFAQCLSVPMYGQGATTTTTDSLRPPAPSAQIYLSASPSKVASAAIPFTDSVSEARAAESSFRGPVFDTSLVSGAPVGPHQMRFYQPYVEHAGLEESELLHLDRVNSGKPS